MNSISTQVLVTIVGLLVLGPLMNAYGFPLLWKVLKLYGAYMDRSEVFLKGLFAKKV